MDRRVFYLLTFDSGKMLHLLVFFKPITILLMTLDKNTGFFGHPVALSSLFATEMWERFSYYGMRALLVLFLTATYATGGFGMSELEAFTVYGIFTGLVYVTPIIGGILADKILGQRKSIYIGAVVMAIGQFTLAASSMAVDSDIEIRKMFFYAGLGVLILGNGFFKPNISTMVGELYDNNDPRKDGGFTIFYMGINLGAFLSPMIAGSLGEQVAWHYGFLAAGTGMVIWINGVASTFGSNVNRYSGSGDVTGIAVRRNRVIVQHDDAGPVTNANMGTWDNANDSDVNYDVDASNNLTVEAGSKLIVNTNDTFTPGGTVTIAADANGDLLIMAGATLNGTYDVTVNGGDVTGDGTINLTGGTFTLDGAGNFGGATGWNGQPLRLA